MSTVVVTGPTTATVITANIAGPRSGTHEIDVSSYGAIGDGVTDDTLAIQAALNAVPSQAVNAWVYAPRGAEVCLGPGAYRVSAPLVMKRGTRLRGAGKEASVIVYTATTGDILSYIRPNEAMSLEPLISIKDLSVTVQNGVTHTSGACVRIDSEDPNNSSGKGVQVELENVTCFFGYEGFRLRNVLGGTVRACRAHYCGSSGFVFRGFQTLLSVESCWASGCADKGWDISGPAYCRWTACGADSNAGYGWYVFPTLGGQAMLANHWHAGSEQNGVLFHFEGLGPANTATLLGLGRTSSPPFTSNGLELSNCQGFVCSPYIAGSAVCTGFAILVEANCDLIVFQGGDWSVYAQGGLLTGGQTGTVTLIGCVGTQNYSRFPKTLRAYGAVQLDSLAGVGSRAVVVGSDGTLSAP